jgi:hypothetical protein
MKRMLVLVCLLAFPLAGCKPTTTVQTPGDEISPTDDPKPLGGKGEVKPEDLPKDPARDLSEEQKQVDAMDVAALVEALGNDKLYLVAVDELKTRGPEAVEPLMAALDHKNEDVRQSAMLALGMLGSDAKSALPKLKAIAADDDQSEIITATAANAVDAIEGN